MATTDKMNEAQAQTRFKLDVPALERLVAGRKNCTNPAQDAHLTVMLHGNADWQPAQIARFLDIPEATVVGYLKGYNEQGIGALPRFGGG